MEINLDNHKLMLHPERVCKWMNKETTYPIYVEVSLTNRCNHKCQFCAINFSQTEKVDMDTEVIKSAITDMAKSGVKSIMFGGEGEPLLHKDIVSIVKHARSNGMDVAITTNGVLFTSQMIEQLLPLLSWIKFSVDSGDFYVYAKLHGTKLMDYKTVMDNISRASFLKRKHNLKVKIGVQVILFKENITTIPHLAEALKCIKPDYLVIKPYSKHEKGINPDLEPPTAEQVNVMLNFMENLDKDYEFVYREHAFDNVNEKKPYDECYGQDFVAYIDTKGNVYSCINFIGDENYCYGNIYKTPFQEIWKGKKWIKPDLTTCRTICRLDEINRYLFRLKNPKGEDNFI